MIARNRNWAIVIFALALGLLVLAGYLEHDVSRQQFRRSYHDWKEVAWIISLVTGTGFIIWGSAELAQAKGYRNGEAPVLILIGIFCCPIIIYVLPFLVIFALKDKAKDEKRFRR